MSTKLLNLQALRGLACVVVVLTHVASWELYNRNINPRIHYLCPFNYFGPGSVEIFFVISGFVLTWVHFDKLGKPAELRSFAWKRFWASIPFTGSSS